MNLVFIMLAMLAQVLWNTDVIVSGSKISESDFPFSLPTGHLFAHNISLFLRLFHDTSAVELFLYPFSFSHVVAF